MRRKRAALGGRRHSYAHNSTSINATTQVQVRVLMPKTPCRSCPAWLHTSHQVSGLELSIAMEPSELARRTPSCFRPERPSICDEPHADPSQLNAPGKVVRRRDVTGDTRALPSRPRRVAPVVAPITSRQEAACAQRRKRIRYAAPFATLIDARLGRAHVSTTLTRPTSSKHNIRTTFHGLRACRASECRVSRIMSGETRRRDPTSEPSRAAFDAPYHFLGRRLTNCDVEQRTDCDP